MAICLHFIICYKVLDYNIHNRTYFDSCYINTYKGMMYMYTALSHTHTHTNTYIYKKHTHTHTHLTHPVIIPLIVT